jgi:hypothetical protein
MIRGFFRQTGIQVDVAFQRSCRKHGCGKDVIDPPAEPPPHRLRNTVIKESITVRLSRMQPAVHINQTPGSDGGERPPHLRGETDVAEETFRVVDVDLLRGDVEVAAPDQRGVRGVGPGEELSQPLEPFEFVREMGCLTLPSLGDVRIYDGNPRKDGGDQPVFVGRTSVGKAKANLFRFFPRGYRHAIILLCPPESHVIARLPKLALGKLSVRHLRLLHAQHIGSVFAKPGEDDMETAPDGIDVVRGYPEYSHRSLSFFHVICGQNSTISHRDQGLLPHFP